MGRAALATVITYRSPYFLILFPTILPTVYFQNDYVDSAVAASSGTKGSDDTGQKGEHMPVMWVR